MESQSRMELSQIMPAGSLCLQPEKCNTILSLFSPSGRPCCQTGQSLFCWSVPTAPTGRSLEPAVYLFLNLPFVWLRCGHAEGVTTFYMSLYSCVLYQVFWTGVVHGSGYSFICDRLSLGTDVPDVICWAWKAFGVVQLWRLGVVRYRWPSFLMLIRWRTSCACMSLTGQALLQLFFIKDAMKKPLHMLWNNKFRQNITQCRMATNGRFRRLLKSV